MAITIQNNRNTTRVCIDGEMTIYSASAYNEKLKQEVLPGNDLEFDLSAVDEIDSSGLQLVAIYGLQASGNGASISFVGCSEAAANALDRSRLRVALNCDEQV